MVDLTVCRDLFRCGWLLATASTDATEGRLAREERREDICNRRADRQNQNNKIDIKMKKLYQRVMDKINT